MYVGTHREPLVYVGLPRPELVKVGLFLPSPSVSKVSYIPGIYPQLQIPNPSVLIPTPDTF